MTIKKIILRSVSIFIVSAVGIASYFLYQEHIATRNFRSGDQTIVSRRFFEAKCIANLFNHNPLLKDLRISGSAYPNLNVLDALMKEKKVSPDKVYILDLSSGQMPYLDQHALKWYGYKDLASISDTSIEKTFSRTLFLGLKAKYYQLKSGKVFRDITESDLSTEKEAIEKRGYHYLNPMPTDWLVDWSFVDELVRIFETIPDDAWLYFHCAHGHGRTTTSMLIYDILKSDRSIPLNHILKRQYCIGGEDVRNTEVWENGTWDENELKAREKIIYFFYDYMHDPKGYPKNTFMDWKAKKGLLNPMTIKSKS